MAEFHGHVDKVTMNVGSRSERPTVVLRTDEDGLLVLRRPGSDPWNDDALERLVGRDLTCRGELYRGQLHLTNFEELVEDSSPPSRKR